MCLSCNSYENCAERKRKMRKTKLQNKGNGREDIRNRIAKMDEIQKQCQNFSKRE